MLKRIFAVGLCVQGAVALACVAHLHSAKTAPAPVVQLEEPSWIICRSGRCVNEMDELVKRDLEDGLWATIEVTRK